MTAASSTVAPILTYTLPGAGSNSHGTWLHPGIAPGEMTFPLPTAPVATIVAMSNSSWVSPQYPFRGCRLWFSPTDNLMPRTLSCAATIYGETPCLPVP
jgi:hypothetical protein